MYEPAGILPAGLFVFLMKLSVSCSVSYSPLFSPSFILGLAFKYAH